MTEGTSNNLNVGSGVLQVPLHRRIAENLTNQVTNGELKPGQKLPSERRIAHQFNASRATVRTALQHLEQAGLITRRDRRSAVVTIRRDITPYLRLASCNSHLMNLVRKLSDTHILPPRCQLQRLDLQQPDILGQMLAQPASGVDILFCSIEYINSLRAEKNLFSVLPQHLVNDSNVTDTLVSCFNEENKFIAIPLSVSPMVLFYNKAMFRERQQTIPTGDWHWHELADLAKQFTYDGQYGFQFRPTFGHLTCLMSRRGGVLYQDNGKVASNTSGTFEDTIRFANELLHVSHVSPLLAKVEQINLFSQKRCAMAMDGFEMLGQYQTALGDDLGVVALPGDPSGNSITNGFAAMIMGETDNLQPIEDMLRTLLNVKTQQVLSQIGAGLPVRSDLQDNTTLEDIGVPTEIGNVFLQEAKDFQYANMPESLDHKIAVENLFVELWLGLDNVDSICQRFKELG